VFKIDEKKLEESITTFDNFMNLALDKLSGNPDVNIVKIMTAYNVIKTALSSVKLNNVND
jgi:hypothetical protein